MLRSSHTTNLPATVKRIYTTEHVETRDGWRLVAHRVRPAGRRERVPVILVHGHGTGAWTFLGGLDGGYAGALADAGRDVWAVELRGSNDTIHMDGATDVRISDKLGIDLHALIDHIRRRTGSEVVDAVGHSMGGILLYLGALTDSSWPIRRAVTVGSPLAVSRRTVPRPLRSMAARFLTRRVGRLRVAGLMGRLSGRMQASWMPAHFEPGSINRQTFEAFLQSGIADVYGSELNELLRWVDSADPRALLPRGTEQQTGRLTVPTRFLVGSEDPLTTPAAVRKAWATIGSPDCEYVELGRETGFSRDYRHLDVLLGDSVRDEISPLIIDWLERDLAVQTLQRAAG